MAESPSAVDVRAQQCAEVTLRPATVDDIPALRALGEAVVPPTYGPIDAAYAQRMLDEWWTAERFADTLPRVRMLVAERDGQVVAMSSFGRLSASHRDFPHVTGDREVMWKLYVHPDHHGLGIGSRLLAEVESMTEGDELWLEVVDGNVRAYDFYVSRGFREVERVTDREWPDDIWLRKPLGGAR
ncbi:GNAT family N-acetyltransferase [Nocardioides ganghwensis]|uniref:GNAT family N-acetyltransferase n=1 Tax=Nocardioides ganghwensis TaxID=252230 RepID=A0A4Q2S8S6_9ACTN|nr:GNAT family N-acetyltransferase [Nocardioides ganghwensis]MBD3944241.1 GNAT family N-acetyltransferase [Nocardioides ganghwensis]RYC00018.1 GNAT family N-acetyltransferase [Nocardioides ganghwensis]